jgi:MinD-like ATPase involved in chromosome partitioning or flagellar assembly
MNDYLNGTCGIENVLVKCKTGKDSLGELFVGLADPSIEAIRQISNTDKAWEMRALRQLIMLRSVLTQEMSFDQVFLDISPGLSYSSINAVLAADLLLIVTSLNESDLAGTHRMFELYKLLDKKIAVVLNKAAAADISSRIHGRTVARPEPVILPVVDSIPCFCDVLGAAGGCLFPYDKPQHPFTEKIREIAARLEQLWNANGLKISTALDLQSAAAQGEIH